MKVGAQLFTVREFTKTVDGVAETFEKVARAGYRCVQVSGFGASVSPEDVARLAEGAGLEIAATHMGWPKFRDEIDQVIEIHQRWKCRHTAIGSLPKEYFSKEGLERFARELEPVAARLAEAGMDFSHHNHDHEFARLPGMDSIFIHALLERIPAEQLKMEFDVHWIVRGGGDPADWIRKVGKRQPLVHVKDFAVTPEREPRFAPVGEGNLNWPAILEACREVEAEYLLVEQDQCYGEDPFDCLARSLKNLQSWGYS